MKLYVLSKVLSLLILGACGGNHNVTIKEGRIDSPEKLLRAILNRSRTGDYEGMRELAYPALVPAYRGLTVQDVFIQAMKEKKGKSRTGDFSYSDEALELILREHLGKFTSNISPLWLEELKEDGLLDQRLIEKAKEDSQLFKTLDYKGVHIFLVKLDGEYKLLFWEGMNLLFENNLKDDR